MPQSEVTRGISGIHIQVEQHRGQILTGTHGSEINCGCRRSHAAFDSSKRVHSAKLRGLAVDTLKMLLQAFHGFAKLGAFDGLLEEVGSAKTHRTQQKILTANRV